MTYIRIELTKKDNGKYWTFTDIEFIIGIFLIMLLTKLLGFLGLIISSVSVLFIHSLNFLIMKKWCY